ncbi:MAG: DUF433 domain-containing protein [Methanosarcinales archaeon]
MRIAIDEKIMHGKPVVRGTRVPVEVILGSLAGGMSYEEVCREYRITKEDILACLEYAAKLIGEEEIHLIGGS